MYTAYSFITLDALEQLNTTGRIIPPPVYYGTMGEDDQQFQKAYQWLHHQMITRHVQYLYDRSGMHWMYIQTPHGVGKPDMRYRSYKRFINNGNMALLTLRIPKERVLVSDYDGWHWVLNNWYLHNSTTEDFDLIHDWLDLVGNTNPRKAKSLRKQSWLQIFNTATMHEFLECDPKTLTWQGTAFDLCESDVVGIQVYNNGIRVK